MNTKALYAKMKEKGVSITKMYSHLGISRTAFYRKCNSKSEFTLKEINQIIEFLEIDDPKEIFFDSKVS